MGEKWEKIDNGRKMGENRQWEKNGRKFAGGGGSEPGGPGRANSGIYKGKNSYTHIWEQYFQNIQVRSTKTAQNRKFEK